MKTVLHWSQISTFLRCPEQFRRRYILGQKQPPGVALIVGSGTHESIESNMLAKRDLERLLEVEEVKAIARDAVNRRWEQGVELSKEEQSVGAAITRGAAVDVATKLSTLHHGELAPKIQPEYIEERWVVEMPNYPWNLGGTTDLQEEECGPIIDTKTRKASPPAGTVDKMDQLTLYSLHAYLRDGKIPEVRLDALVKTKKPKVVTQSAKRTKEQFSALIDRITEVWRTIDKGSFPPVARDHWACSPKYCGFYDTCKFVKGYKVF